MTDCTISGSTSDVLHSGSLVVFQHCLLFAEQAVATTNKSKFEGRNIFPDAADLCKFSDVSANSYILIWPNVPQDIV